MRPIAIKPFIHAWSFLSIKYKIIKAGISISKKYSSTNIPIILKSITETYNQNTAFITSFCQAARSPV